MAEKMRSSARLNDTRFDDLEKVFTWFLQPDEPAPIIIDRSLRREWMLNHKRLLRQGRFREVEFKSIGDRMYEMSLSAVEEQGT